MVRGAVLPTTILLMLNMIETWQAFSPLDRLMYLYVYLCVCVGMHAGLFVVSGNFLCSQYVFSAMLCSSVSAFFILSRLFSGDTAGDWWHGKGASRVPTASFH